MTEPSKQDERLDEVLDIDDLLALAEVTEDDAAEAIEWWNETASAVWRNAINETGQE